MTGTAAKGPYGEWGVVMPLRSGHNSVSQFAKIIQFSVFIYESLITILLYQYIFFDLIPLIDFGPIFLILKFSGGHSASKKFQVQKIPS